MSTSWPDDVFANEQDPRVTIRVFQAKGFPPAVHPAEPDLFARHHAVPGNEQGALAEARVLIVGAGGLGSWTALALARSGARQIFLVDPDRFDRTNAPRQLMFGSDLGKFKAIALANNLVDHMVAGGQIIAIPLPFEQVVREFALPIDVALFLVDNNRCRFEGIRFARRRQIRAVFAMMSGDGQRLHTFLQGSTRHDACLHCALPNLNEATGAPCAAATITSCLLAASYITFFTHRAVMGWPVDVPQFNWREADLLGVAPERTATVAWRPICPTCSTLR